MSQLPDLGPQPLGRIIRLVLAVARLGEADRLQWWGTRSFGAAGRVVLGQRLPRTWRMAAVELDIAAATKRHNDIIDRPTAVHLFSDNWPVRRWVSAWVSEQKTATPPDPIFHALESASADTLLTSTESEAAPAPTSGSKATRVGSVARADLHSPDTLEPAVTMLAAVYPRLDDDFGVPYLEVEG